MSLDNIKEYIQLLIKEYEFDEATLLKIWTDKHPIEKEEEDATLTRKKKVELQAMCKERNLPVTGSKQVLIDRLLSPNPPPKSSPKAKKKSSKKVAVVLQQLMSRNTAINVRRNLFNNYEHVTTGFIFDESNHNVIGKQNNDGTIDQLTEQDIELCKEYKFNYEIPVTIVPDETYNDELMYID